MNVEQDHVAEGNDPRVASKYKCGYPRMCAVALFSASLT